jgi:hypothetical protein
VDKEVHNTGHLASFKNNNGNWRCCPSMSKIQGSILAGFSVHFLHCFSIAHIKNEEKWLINFTICPNRSQIWIYSLVRMAATKRQVKAL